MSDQKFDVRVLSMDGEIYERLRRKEIDTEKRLSFSDAQNLSVTKNEDVKVNVRRGMTRLYVERLQGKVLSLLETWQFLKTSPPHFLLGAGTTRFSSLTAQKMAGYDSSRLFMNILPHYISPYYKENHLLILEERRKGDKAYLSNANWPDSFINQLLGEYGVIGAMLFVFFYLGYFYKTIRYGSYAPWLVILVLSFVHLTYLFEPLSVLVFFELLLIAREAELKKQYE
jgi:hypothetical protein